MHMSDSLPPAFWAGYERAWPFDPGYERRRPALQLHHLLLQVRHFNPQRYRHRSPSGSTWLRRLTARGSGM